MNYRHLLAAGFCGLCGLGLSLSVYAEQAAEAPAQSAENVHAMDTDAMAQAMAEFARISMPNEHHERLAESVGTWDVASRFWMAPGMPPQETTGESVIEPILGGRYIQEQYNGTVQMPGMEPQPFQGMGVFGYDVAKEQYVGIWTDTMSTAPMVTAGQYDESTKTITLSCEFDCPMQGPSTMKMTHTQVSPNEFIVTGYQTPQGGEEAKVMELTYKRRY
ncbi:MAG: DUF1579 domain-containing protein [Phycisphaerales bacterium]